MVVVAEKEEIAIRYKSRNKRHTHTHTHTHTLNGNFIPRPSYPPLQIRKAQGRG